MKLKKFKYMNILMSFLTIFLFSIGFSSFYIIPGTFEFNLNSTENVNFGEVIPLVDGLNKIKDSEFTFNWVLNNGSYYFKRTSIGFEMTLNRTAYSNYISSLKNDNQQLSIFTYASGGSIDFFSPSNYIESNSIGRIYFKEAPEIYIESNSNSFSTTTSSGFMNNSYFYLNNINHNNLERFFTSFNTNSNSVNLVFELNIFLDSNLDTNQIRTLFNEYSTTNFIFKYNIGG